MLLTLRPPDSYTIPEALQTHTISLPSLPQDVRAPATYVAMRRALLGVGIRIPSLLCADRTVWWSFAIGHVTWDLELEQVVVKFTDGMVECWSLDPDARPPPHAVGPDQEAKVSQQHHSRALTEKRSLTAVHS